MKKVFVTLGLSAVTTLLSAIELDIVTTEAKHYKVGETVTFLATAWENDTEKLSQGTVTLTFSNSGGKQIREDLTLDFSRENPVRFTAKLNQPGFILVKSGACQMPDGKKVAWSRKKYYPNGGAAVEPEKIRAGEKTPADFNQFWQEGIKEFEKAEIILTPVNNKALPDHKNYKVLVKFPDGSGAVDGFLSIPSAPGKYPASASIPGAGPGIVTSYYPFGRYTPSILLWMNVHPFRTAATSKEQRKLYNQYNASLPTRTYIYHNALDRKKYVFRNAWLAMNRMIDYVAALPEFDGKHFVAIGSSQGGGSALAVGSMNKNISCIVASVPALCDHGGWKADRQAGWPQLHKKFRGKADAAAAYFDGANFAKNIKVPTLVLVGNIDTTCSPSSVLAAYNNIASKEKKIVYFPRFGHVLAKEMLIPVNKFLDEQFAK